MMEWLAAAAPPAAAWIIYVERRIAKLAAVEEKVDRVESQVDRLVDHLIDGKVTGKVNGKA